MVIRTYYGGKDDDMSHEQDIAAEMQRRNQKILVYKDILDTYFKSLLILTEGTRIALITNGMTPEDAAVNVHKKASEFQSALKAKAEQPARRSILTPNNGG